MIIPLYFNDNLMIMIKSWMDCRQDISEDLQTFYLGRKFSTGVNTQN
jgi:hypothetical protein